MAATHPAPAAPAHGAPEAGASLHHPLAEVIQHITSPLTSSLCIFGTYKSSHIPKIKAWMTAVAILRRASRTKATSAAARSASTSASAGASSPLASSSSSSASSRGPYSPSPFASGQVRSFSSLRSAAVPAARLAGSGAAPRTPTRSLASLASSSSLLAAPAQGSLLFRSTGGRIAAALPLAGVAGFSHIRRNLSSSTSVLGPNDHHFFPLSFYVESPLTHCDIVMSSEPIQQFISYFHHGMGMPWWQSMIAVTLLFRTVVLPINVSLIRNTLRLHKIKPEIKRLQQLMKEGDEETKVQAATDLVQLFKDNKCHPTKNVISPILFPPMFLSLFGAVLDISSNHPEAVSGGALWFQNLSVPDPTFILPVLSALSWLATIELASGERVPLKPWVLNWTRLFAIAFIPVTFNLPAGVFMFWITSNLFACTRALVVRRPTVAKALGVPVFEDDFKQQQHHYQPK